MTRRFPWWAALGTAFMGLTVASAILTPHSFSMSSMPDLRFVRGPWRVYVWLKTGTGHCAAAWHVYPYQEWMPPPDPVPSLLGGRSWRFLRDTPDAFFAEFPDGREVHVGWPWSSAAYTVGLVDRSGEANTAALRDGALLRPSAAGANVPSRLEASILPLRVYWLNLALNWLTWTAIGGALIETLVLAYVSARGRRRRARGLCPECGYRPGPARARRCPECGAPIAESVVPER